MELSLEERAAQLRKPSGEAASVIMDFMNRGNTEMYRHAIDMLNHRGNEHLLEIGPGNGNALEEILSKAAGLRYTGLDYSQDSVRLALEKNRVYCDSGQARFIKGEVRNLPFEAHSFDSILGCNIIYFFDHPDREFAELNRVLKPGGQLVFGFRPERTMVHYPFVSFGFTTYSPEKLTRVLESHGFSNIEHREWDEPDREMDGGKFKVAHAVLRAVK